MRTGAGLAVLVFVGAIATPIATAKPVAAQTPPTLTLVGPPNGPPGTPVTYDYAWNAVDCAASGVVPGAAQIDITWGDAGATPMPPGTADLNCSGTVTGVVPGDATPGLPIAANAVLCDDATSACPPASDASNTSFVVTSSQ